MDVENEGGIDQNKKGEEANNWGRGEDDAYFNYIGNDNDGDRADFFGDFDISGVQVNLSNQSYNPSEHNMQEEANEIPKYSVTEKTKYKTRKKKK